MTKSAIRTFLGLGAALMLPACGGGGGGGGGRSDIVATWIDLSGGSATGSIVPGTAGGGGAATSNLISTGDIRMGVTAAPPVPTIPGVPTTGTAVTSLAADQTVPRGNVIIDSTVVGAGASTRTITASEGDIIVSGVLNAGQNAGTQINLNLDAPLGTVFITGTVRTADIDGVPDGNRGGTLTITARKIVVTGQIDVSGEMNNAGNGGAAGALFLETQLVTGGSDIIVSGTILAAGGNSSGGSGGQGGTVTLLARNDIFLGGRVATDGGNATGTTTLLQGGNGGSLSIDGRSTVSINAVITQSGGSAAGTGAAVGAQGSAGGSLSIGGSAPSGPVFLYGSLSARGGDASAPSGDAGNRITGGTGGLLTIGTSSTPANSPSSIDFGGTTWNSRGGDSSDAGGSVGGINLFSNAATPGNITVLATLDLSGGRGVNSGGRVLGGFLALATAGDINFFGSLTARGANGSVNPGYVLNALRLFTQSPAGGDIRFQGSIDATGGSSTAPTGTSVGGAGGGTIQFQAASATGRVFVLPGSSISADGGSSTGPAIAGTGGNLQVITRDNSISLAGTFVARGGSAPDGGGTGGQGGQVFAISDSNNDGVGGDITLSDGSVIDVSGGPGAAGGSARAGAAAGLQAVIFDADGANTVPVASNGIVANNGTILARGGAGGGNGGDVLFDGQATTGLITPLPGIQDLSGAVSGTFLHQ